MTYQLTSNFDFEITLGYLFSYFNNNIEVHSQDIETKHSTGTKIGIFFWDWIIILGIFKVPPHSQVYVCI